MKTSEFLPQDLLSSQMSCFCIILWDLTACCLVKMFLFTPTLHLNYIPSMDNLRATYINNTPTACQSPKETVLRRMSWQEPPRLSRTLGGLLPI